MKEYYVLKIKLQKWFEHHKACSECNRIRAAFSSPLPKALLAGAHIGGSIEDKVLNAILMFKLATGVKRISTKMIFYIQNISFKLAFQI